MRVVRADPVLDAPMGYEEVCAIMQREPDGITAEPVTALDVAAALLEARGGRSDMYWLQAMVYIAQAIHLKRNGEALYRDEIQAWTDGPVVPRLYKGHHDADAITEIQGADVARFERHPVASETVTLAMQTYGHLGETKLVYVMQTDPPWQVVREGLSPDRPSDRPIPVDLIAGLSKVS